MGLHEGYEFRNVISQGGAEVDQGLPAAGALGLILALDRLLLGGCPVQQGQAQHSAGGPALLGRLSGLTVLPALLRRADGHLSVLADGERVALLQREGVLAACHNHGPHGILHD
ncbi:Uncharacterised protein [Flavonifractor plautii]|uniref:Uncharacterized protein n=1 Tax=Flavonifractor plautii TaxID=292800 RepID=A0A174IBJ9_FLAPL|nr:Uncharacterised protein [Flavonifractor plautii]